MSKYLDELKEKTQPNPNPGKMWNPNVNHMQESFNAAKDGNLAGAMYQEKLHNDKDGDLGLGWGASGVWNYQDKQGLGGLRERKYREIEDHFNNGFNYDYETDPEYQAIKRLKEKEADKAYNDGYAQLSRQFDGDIPVNMINKLLTTKSEIVDQADGYIPTLKQMAYDMYFGKGQQLYNQYGMLGDLENQQYQRFLEDRGFMAQGVNDAWARQYQLDRDAIGDERYEKEWQYQLDRDAIEDKRYEEEWNLKKQKASKTGSSSNTKKKNASTLTSLTNMFFEEGDTVEESIKKANKMYDLYY